MPFRKTAHLRLDSLAGLLLLVAFFVGLFFILRGLFYVMIWVAPVLLIAAFIIDRSVVINYVKWLANTVKSNPLVGIAAIIFSLLGYMVVFPFLFAKALLKKKVKDVQKQYEQDRQGELIDYEEIDSKPHTPSETLEVPRMEQKSKRTKYDKLFD